MSRSISGGPPPDRPIPGSEPADLGEAYQSRGVDTLQVTMWLGPVTRGRNTDEIETRYTMSKTHSIPADPHTIVERTGSAADAAERNLARNTQRSYRDALTLMVFVYRPAGQIPPNPVT